MTARIHSAVRHRVAVPAWLLAAVIAAAIAASLFAVLDTASDPVPTTQLPATAHDLRRLERGRPLLTIGAPAV